jgi:hypothetical protein
MRRMTLRVKKGFVNLTEKKDPLEEDLDLVSKKDSRLMRLIGFFYPAFMTSMWTTIGNKIYYPTSVKSPLSARHFSIIKHEVVHVKQFKKYGIPFFLFLYLFCPLPLFFSYFRWKFEREAYFHADIKNEKDIDRIVNILSKYYLRPWPKTWMRKWFIEQLERRQNEKRSRPIF